MQHSHCSYCGTKYKFTSAEWPRTCTHCNKITWRNPLPVVVLLVPVEEGILLVRRGENPAKGELALPGGYLVCNETWQEGSVREVLEETGINIDPKSITLETVISSTEGDNLLVFGKAPKQSASVLQGFKPNSEVTELVIVNEPVELIWASHRAVLRNFFVNRARTRHTREISE